MLNPVSPDNVSAVLGGLDASSRTLSPESLRLATRRPAGRQPVVLLAEDDVRGREALRMLIEMQGCTVIEAADGAQALAFGTAFAGPVDLFVSDARMPGLSGPQVYEGLRLARPSLPALFVSGYAEAELFPDGGLPRGAAFLRKPFTPSEFATAFERLAPQTVSHRLTIA